MTEWNPDNPFDLGVWENLGLPLPLSGIQPEGYTPPKLPIPPVLDPQDLCRSPEAKKARKSLKLKKLPPPSMECEASATEEESQASTSRFISPTKSLDTYQRGHVPKNTEVNTQWAVANFNEWQADYNSRHPDQPCPEDILLSDSSKDLSYWLQKYVLGTRKKSGEKYPPKTVYLLLCGLNRYMKGKKLNSFNIFNHDNPDFKLLFNNCDSLSRELREEGHGSESKATEPITKEDEEKLWPTGVLSLFTPQGLLNAVFFLNGKNFALRGGAEHWCLKLAQISRNVSPEGKVRYTYTENCSKNRAGGFNQLSVPNKVVHQYQDVDAGEHCHVHVLDKYLQKLPPNAYDLDIFYLRPVAKKPVNDSPWYISVAVGKNPLSKMLKTMCEEAGVTGHKTNHSLRAYAATELFNAGIPEKVIQDRTGHRPLDGLREYETISEQQTEAACKVLAVRGGDSEQKAMTQANGASNVPALTSAMHTSQAFIRQDSQMVPNFSYKDVQSMCTKLQCSSHKVR